MPDVDAWVARQNIQRFKEHLARESDASQRRILMSLLEREEEKLYSAAVPGGSSVEAAPAGADHASPDSGRLFSFEVVRSDVVIVRSVCRLAGEASVWPLVEELAAIWRAEEGARIRVKDDGGEIVISTGIRSVAGRREPISSRGGL